MRGALKGDLDRTLSDYWQYLYIVHAKPAKVAHNRRSGRLVILLPIEAEETSAL